MVVSNLKNQNIIPLVKVSLEIEFLRKETKRKWQKCCDKSPEKKLEKALKIAPKLCKYVNLWIRWGYVSQFSRRSKRHYSLTAISRLTRRTASEFIAQWSRLMIINQDFRIYIKKWRLWCSWRLGFS